MDDPVKGVGYVAIYFANLEDELDELIDYTNGVFTLPPKLKNWKFRDKAQWLQKQFRAIYKTHSYPYSGNDSVRAEKILKACRAAALERNELLHRPIFGDLKGGAVQKDVSGKMKSLDIVKIFKFAEYIHELGGGIYSLQFALNKLAKASKGKAA